MIKQNIYIINFNSLYETLDEFKEDLPIKIIKYDNKENLADLFELNIKNSLIISKPGKNYILKNGLIENSFLSNDIYPLKIKKFIELINIELIKLRFNYQSKVIIKDYELNLNSKFFTRDGKSLKLTEKEIEVILYLYRTKKKHNVLDLQKNIWGYSSDMETHTVETHIYRLRKKISDKFNDENFILSRENAYFID